MGWGSSTPFDDVSGEVAIVGVGESGFSGPSGRHAKQIAAEAIEKAISDAGLVPGDIDGIMYGGMLGDQFTAGDFRARFATERELWESAEGGGMVWAATAPYQAAHALRSGKANYIVNSFAVDWATRRPQMTGGPGAWHAAEQMKAQLELPFGWFPQPVYFATFASRHMHDYGTTARQLGQLVTTFREHANGTPGAQMEDRQLSLEEYLARPMVAEPLRVEDCCLISDGGAAFIMTTPERARDLRQRPVAVAGIGHGIIDSAPYISQQADLTSTPQVFAAPAAYAMAGVAPGDIDVLAVYDCFSITALMQIEDMGFCAKGEGGAFVEGGRLRYDNPRVRGGLPTNTHGGLLSHAYVLGIAHVVELVRQLRGEAANQVEAAEIGAYAGFTADEGSTLILRAN
jgi:acetyl-CoA acetyltransferase